MFNRGVGNRACCRPELFIEAYRLGRWT